MLTRVLTTPWLLWLAAPAVIVFDYMLNEFVLPRRKDEVEERKVVRELRKAA